MKKFTIAALVAIIGIACLSGCRPDTSKTGSAGDGIRIYATLSEADTFRNTLLEAARQTAEAEGAEFIVYEAENSIEKQVAQMKQAVSEGYDVILCAPVDADTAQELETIAGDIPIIFYNSCPDASVLEADKYMYVGSDENVAGQYQAEYILNQMADREEINIVLLKGSKNHSATNGRTDGLKNTLALAGKTVNYVFEDYADWNQGLSEKYFDIFLRTGQKADVIVCQNDAMASGAIASCKKNGISGVPVLGIDATADGCAAIEEGSMDFTVYQSAKGQGEMAARAAIALGAGGSAAGIEGLSEDGCYIWVPFEKVDLLNVSDYK